MNWSATPCSSTNWPRLPLRLEPVAQGSLQPVLPSDAQDRVALGRLSRWHSNLERPGSRFVVTLEGVRHWLLQRMLNQSDRALWWVCDGTGEPVGHIGLIGLQSADQMVERIDILAGMPAGEPLVRQAYLSLGAWVRHQGFLLHDGLSRWAEGGSQGIA